MNFTTGWYVLYVKSRCEKKVHNVLKENSLQTFLPQVKTIQQWADRKKIVLKPLFPSYVFVYLNSSNEFYRALSVPGTCCYIRFGKEYPKVTEQEISQIKLLIGEKNITSLETTSQLPKSGEIKKINHGPLNGLHCEVIKADNYEKIIVRIDSLKQNIIATIPNYILSK
jgi:transcriptional antiterminator RfaH